MNTQGRSIDLTETYCVRFACEVERTALELGEVLKEDDHKRSDVLRCFDRGALYSSA